MGTPPAASRSDVDSGAGTTPPVSPSTTPASPSVAAAPKPAPRPHAPNAPVALPVRHPDAQPGETLVNLAVRVRHSIDAWLAELIHELRRDGVRSSKAEIVEMLLWELPPTANQDVRARLATFRRRAPRERQP